MATNSNSDMANPPEQLDALARRIMLDVWKLTRQRGGLVNLLLVMRRLGITDNADAEAAVAVGVELSILTMDGPYVGLGETALKVFARRKLVLDTYAVERGRNAISLARRSDKVLRSRRRGPRAELMSFRERQAMLKAWRNATELPGTC
jgi:hypothetical protein